MSAPVLPRRAFLAHLAGLPMVGGSVALLGRPTAAAVPVTVATLEAYKTFLLQERSLLGWEMAGDPRWCAGYHPAPHGEAHGSDPHADRVAMSRSILSVYKNVGHVLSWFDVDNPPSARATVVLAAAGFDPQGWRSGIDGMPL